MKDGAGCRRRTPATRGSGARGGAVAGLLAAVACLSPGSPAAAQLEAEGVFADSIVFGQSAAFTGPTLELGSNMRLGILAAFEEANRRGGIHGRLLRLRSRDDGYEPEAASDNTHAFINEGVFGLVGAVGTPTSTAAEPVASAAEVPYIGPFTGAEFLREDRDFVVNLRASYFQETEEMVERLTSDLGFTRFAVLYQDDNYGNAGLTGVRLALGRRDMMLVSEGEYVRNTTAVKRALLEIREGNPQAVIIIGAYQPAATFIKWARRIGMSAVFVNISFVGSNALLSELGAAGEDVVVTQVVPFPGDTSTPVVARYHEALEVVDADADPGFVSLEGYLAGRLIAEGLERTGPEPSRGRFLEALREAGPIDLGGFVVEYGDRDNQGSDRVFLTRIRSGRFLPVERLSR